MKQKNRTERAQIIRQVQRLELNKLNWAEELRKLLKSSGKAGALDTNRTSAGIFELIAGVFLTLFARST